MDKKSSLKNWKGKTQENMERGSRKRSSSAGSEKMDKVCGRYEKMEGCCSTGQSPQWAVVPMEEEEEEVCFNDVGFNSLGMEIAPTRMG